MNFFPAGLALSLPAAGAAARLVERVGQGFSSLLASQAESVAEPAQRSGTLSDQLSELANGLRNWLSQRGINSPFEIEVRTGEPSNAARNGGLQNTAALEVRGQQSAEIRQLFQQAPEQLSKLTQLLNSIQSLPNGSSVSTKLEITDLNSTITY